MGGQHSKDPTTGYPYPKPPKPVLIPAMSSRSTPYPAPQPVRMYSSGAPGSANKLSNIPRPAGRLAGHKPSPLIVTRRVCPPVNSNEPVADRGGLGDLKGESHNGGGSLVEKSASESPQLSSRASKGRVSSRLINFRAKFSKARERSTDRSSPKLKSAEDVAARNNSELETNTTCLSNQKSVRSESDTQIQSKINETDLLPQKELGLLTAAGAVNLPDVLPSDGHICNSFVAETPALELPCTKEAEQKSARSVCNDLCCDTESKSDQVMRHFPNLSIGPAANVLFANPCAVDSSEFSSPTTPEGNGNVIVGCESSDTLTVDDPQMKILQNPATGQKPIELTRSTSVPEPNFSPGKPSKQYQKAKRLALKSLSLENGAPLAEFESFVVDQSPQIEVVAFNPGDDGHLGPKKPPILGISPLAKSPGPKSSSSSLSTTTRDRNLTKTSPLGHVLNPSFRLWQKNTVADSLHSPNRFDNVSSAGKSPGFDEEVRSQSISKSPKLTGKDALECLAQVNLASLSPGGNTRSFAQGRLKPASYRRFEYQQSMIYNNPANNNANRRNDVLPLVIPEAINESTNNGAEELGTDDEEEITPRVEEWSGDKCKTSPSEVVVQPCSTEFVDLVCHSNKGHRLNGAVSDKTSCCTSEVSPVAKNELRFMTPLKELDLKSPEHIQQRCDDKLGLHDSGFGRSEDDASYLPSPKDAYTPTSSGQSSHVLSPTSSSPGGRLGDSNPGGSRNGGSGRGLIDDEISDQPNLIIGAERVAKNRQLFDNNYDDQTDDSVNSESEGDDASLLCLDREGTPKPRGVGMNDNPTSIAVGVGELSLDGNSNIDAVPLMRDNWRPDFDEDEDLLRRMGFDRDKTPVGEVIGKGEAILNQSDLCGHPGLSNPRPIVDDLNADGNDGPCSLAGVGRVRDVMTESFNSTISSFSIDSDDLMADFDMGASIDLSESGLGIRDHGGSNGVHRHESFSSLASSGTANSMFMTGSWQHRRKGTSTGSSNAPSGVRRTSYGPVKSASGNSSRLRSLAVDEFEDLMAYYGMEYPALVATPAGGIPTRRPGPSLSGPGSPSTSAGPSSSCGYPLPVTAAPDSYSTAPARTFRPPASAALMLDSTDSMLTLDPHAFRYLVQDVTVLKTLLLRLKRVLQEAETVNPFESSLPHFHKNGVIKAALAELSPTESNAESELPSENMDLRLQIALLQQQMAEKDKTIQILQSKLAQYKRRSSSVRDSKNMEDSIFEGVEKPNDNDAMATRKSCMDRSKGMSTDV